MHLTVVMVFNRTVVSSNLGLMYCACFLASCVLASWLLVSFLSSCVTSRVVLGANVVVACKCNRSNKQMRNRRIEMVNYRRRRAVSLTAEPENTARLNQTRRLFKAKDVLDETVR
jgi:hypothetical protein